MNAFYLCSTSLSVAFTVVVFVVAVVVVAVLLCVWTKNSNDFSDFLYLVFVLA